MEQIHHLGIWSHGHYRTNQVNKDPMEDQERGGETLPEEARGTRLERGPDERLVAGFATEPGRAQPDVGFSVLLAQHSKENLLPC